MHKNCKILIAQYYEIYKNLIFLYKYVQYFSVNVSLFDKYRFDYVIILNHLTLRSQWFIESISFLEIYKCMNFIHILYLY